MDIDTDVFDIEDLTRKSNPIMEPRRSYRSLITTTGISGSREMNYLYRAIIYIAGCNPLCAFMWGIIHNEELCIFRVAMNYLYCRLRSTSHLHVMNYLCWGLFILTVAILFTPSYDELIILLTYLYCRLRSTSRLHVPRRRMYTQQQSLWWS